ncbi:MAG: sigma-70 family RNA polymerase sigma factor [Anaerolineae bacterium]
MDTISDPGSDSSEQHLIAALRAGDDNAFRELVEKHHNALVRIAMIYVKDRAVAEEVAQETWVAVLRGIERFEGRSSLKTWLFTILTNRAKTRATREGRYVPLDVDDDPDSDIGVSLDRFHPPGHDEADHWSAAYMPQRWDNIPEKRMLSLETMNLIMQAIASLPDNQMQVIRLRDVEGFTSEEACNILNISETNQRVLLHRARSRVRQALESYIVNRN